MTVEEIKKTIADQEQEVVNQKSHCFDARVTLDSWQKELDNRMTVLTAMQQRLGTLHAQLAAAQHTADQVPDAASGTADRQPSEPQNEGAQATENQ